MAATVEQIATACIGALAQNRTDEAFPLSYYIEHRDGNCDFVYIEETLSSAIVRAGLDTEADYLAAATIVFKWLKDTHGVTAPRWFLQAVAVPTVTLTLRAVQLDMLQAALDDYLANLDDDHADGGDHAEALATGAALQALLKQKAVQS